MPKYCTLNRNFFKSWSQDMAYVLGYIAADGNISIGKRGNCYLALEGIDKDLIDGVKRTLRAGHRIAERRRTSSSQINYRLQIGSKEIIGDLIALGLTPKKAKRLSLPEVPREYLRDFVRGYFDGDGNVCLSIFKRSDRPRGFCRYIRILFTSSSRGMLSAMARRLESDLGVKGARLACRDNYYLLYYYKNDEIKRIFALFYEHQPTLYLNRKFVYFKEALERMRGGR